MRVMETESKNGLEKTMWYGFSNMSQIECVQHVKFIEFMLTMGDVYSNNEGSITACYNIAVHNFYSITEAN